MKELRINYQTIRFGSFLFLIVPVVLFFIGFIRWYISFPAILFLGYTLWKTGLETNKKYISFSKISIIFILIILIVWCYLGGQGGLFYQTSDWNERNAIFRDLIQFDWPVYYEKTDTLLTYYIGHWLPAAGLGKLIFMISSNLKLAFQIGNIFLGLWTFIGILLTFLLMNIYIVPKTKNAKWIILAVFIGFSGLDLIGCVIEKWNWQTFMGLMHLEWWSQGYQFSSNTTALFWVFNQAVPAWIATMLFLNEKAPKNYVLIISSLLLAATFPAVGLTTIMIGKYIKSFIEAICKKEYNVLFLKTFSISNIGTLLFVSPAIISYLLMNSAIGKTKDNQYVLPDQFHLTLTMKILMVFIAAASVAGLLYIWKKRERIKQENVLKFILGSSILLILLLVMVVTHPETRRIYFIFLALECGIYWLCLAPDYASCYLYYLIAATFLIFPMIHIGTSIDFGMRASIPSLLILTVLSANKLINWSYNRKLNKNTKIKSVSSIILIFFLCLGSITPFVEIGRGIYKVVEAKTINLPADQIKTLNRYHESGRTYYNFVSENYENSIFYKQFMREIKERS